MKLTKKQKYNIVDIAYQISFLIVFVSFIPFMFDLMGDWRLDTYYFPVAFVIWMGIIYIKGRYFFYPPQEDKE